MNTKELAENLGLEEEDCRELLELFLETTATNLARLDSGLAAADSKQVMEAAHTIKGSSANLGLAKIAAVAREVEERARQNNLEEVDKAMQSIREACKQLADELKSAP